VFWLGMSIRPKVFVTRVIPEAGLASIREACDVEIWPARMPPSRQELLRRVPGCAGLISLLSDAIDGEVMDAAGPQLKVISNFAVGYNNIDVAEAALRGIKVGNTPGVLTDATADIAVALLLAASRCLVSSERSIHVGDWQTWEPMGFLGQELTGKTLGIVGLGRIGTATARRLRGGWGMQVIYTGRSRNETAERELQAQHVAFDELLARSDFVSAHCALTDETKHLFDAAAFRKMKQTAVFVNTARGPVHVQQDLYEALRDGHIFAAGLDVTDPEPLAADDPLLELPNCVITPHIASATVETRDAMASIAAANLLAGLSGRPLPHEVRV
jgi:glyoxylate reductase